MKKKERVADGEGQHFVKDGQQKGKKTKGKV